MELRVKPMQGAKERAAQEVVGLGRTGAGQALVSDRRRGVDAWDVHSGTKLKTWAQPPRSELAAPAVYHAATKTLLAPAADGRVLVCDAAAPALVPAVQSERLPGAPWRVVPVPSSPTRVAVVLCDGAVVSCDVRTGHIAPCASPIVPASASNASANTATPSKNKKKASKASKSSSTTATESSASDVKVLAAGVAGATLYVAADVPVGTGSERALAVSAVALASDAAGWRARGVAVLERGPACVAAALHGPTGTLFAVRRDAAWRTHALAQAAWAPDLAAALAAPEKDAAGARGSLACLACDCAPVAVAWAARDALLVAGTLTDVWQARRRVPPPGARVVMVLELVFGTALCVRPLDASTSYASESAKGALHLLCLDTPETEEEESQAQEKEEGSGAATAVVALDGALFGCEVRLAPVSLGDAIARGLPTSCQLDPPLSVMTRILPPHSWSMAVCDELDDEEEEQEEDDEDDDSEDEDETSSDDEEEEKDQKKKGKGKNKKSKTRVSALEEGYRRTRPFEEAERAWPETVGEPNAEELEAIAEIVAPGTPSARVVERVRGLLRVHDARDAPRMLRHLLRRSRTRGSGGVPVRRAVSFRLVQAVAQRACAERDVRAVWRAVEPLLTCGVVTHCAAPRLLAACVAQQHLAGLELCLLCMREIPDAAVVAVLRHVLALPEAPLAAFARAHPLLGPATASAQPAAAAAVARAHLLTRVLVLPRNEVFAHKHLKQLSAEQVSAFLAFLAQWLDEIHGNRPDDTEGNNKGAGAAEGKAEGEGTSGDTECGNPVHTAARACGAAPTLRQVVSWTETLIDAHVASLVLTPDSQGTLAHIAACLRGELALCRELDAIQPLLAQLKTPATLPHEEIPPYQIEFISF